MAHSASVRLADRLALVLAIGALLLAAAGPADAQPAGATVSTIVVRYRDEVAGPELAAIPASLAQSLARELPVAFGVAGRTKSGGFVLALARPMTFAEARSALDRVRMDPLLLHATPVVTSPVPAAAVLAADADAHGARPIRRLVVRYRTASYALARGVPTAAQMRGFEAHAGTAAAFVRATFDGASVIALAEPRSLADAHAIAGALAASPDVDYAQPDYPVAAHARPTDPCFASAASAECFNGNFQWDLFEPAGGIDAPGAWDLTTGSAGVRIAVLDTGYLPHPDLAGRIVGGYDFIRDCAVANDDRANCTFAPLPYVPGVSAPAAASRDADALDPGDWITAAENAPARPLAPPYYDWFESCVSSSPYYSDSSFHGTHVAGTIAASANNGIGIAGINWTSPVVPVRVLGKCGGQSSDIADAIVWAAGGAVGGAPVNPHPAKVLNLSLGGYLGATRTCPVHDPLTQSAIDTALAYGSTVVVSAGNDDADASHYSPAGCSGVIAVAATTRNGGRAFYSNYGAAVAIAAPGGSRTANDYSYQPSILSTLNSGLRDPDPTPAGFVYRNKAGTSMAAPHVTGVVSLMLARDPSLMPSQVASILSRSARPFRRDTTGSCTSDPAGDDPLARYCGAGLVDAAAAVATVRAAPSSPRSPLAKAGAPVDLDGDGRADVLWANLATGETIAWLMNGLSPAGGGPVAAPASSRPTHTGDFDGDGRTDLVFRDPATGVTTIALMEGASVVGATGVLARPEWSVVGVGDFNGDGRSDLLWRHATTGEVVAWLMNGAAIAGWGSLLSDPAWTVQHVADFDGDGRDDILWRHATSGETAIWLMRGTSFAGGGTILADREWVVTHVADFDGDGKADLLWRRSSGETAIWLMDGWRLRGGAGVLADADWRVVATGDLDGDGRADLLWRHAPSGGTAAWLVNGFTFVAGTGLTPSGAWDIAGTADLDGDGRADILWVNAATGEKAAWRMNGLSIAAGALLPTGPSWRYAP